MTWRWLLRLLTKRVGKLVLVISEDFNFATKVVETMRGGGHRAERVVFSISEIQGWLGERTPDLVIIGEELPRYRRCALIRMLRERDIYEGLILACESQPKFWELLKSTGATRTCASHQWPVPACDLLGLMVTE